MASVKSREEQDDEPPMSRLFIICNKTNTEEEFRESFKQFGTIEEIWIVKDKLTGEHKGVAYVKFSKTSEAAKALEEMNGKLIGKSQRPIKVLVASSRNQGRTKTENEFEKYIRLFVIVPKEMTEKDLTDEFSIYGDLDSISLIRDKSTGERKGFAYVKYHKFSDAAKAFESCDRRFKAVFAEPKPMRQNSSSSLCLSYDGSASSLDGLGRRGGGGPMGGGGVGGGGGGGPGGMPKDFFGGMPAPAAFASPMATRSFNNSAIFVKMATNGDRGGGGGALPTNGSSQLVGGGVLAAGPLPPHQEYSLNVICSALINQDQLWRLFDIIPGLDYCQIIGGESGPNANRAIVKYNNLESCIYAKDKLHGLEYPLGERLIVKMDISVSVNTNASSLLGAATTSPTRSPPNARAHLNAVAAGANDLPMMDGRDGGNLCSVSLPPPAQLAHVGSVCAQRCFLVCVSQTLPIPILRNVFSRFGHLIDIYLLPNKNCGYAKYASEESCRSAIETLHGAEICGVRMRVMEAEELSSERKRCRRDE